MTDLHFDATLAGDGLLVRISDENLTALKAYLDELLRLLEDDVVPPKRKPWWRKPSADELKRRMFEVSDEFWSRHREVLADPGSARWVRTRLDEPTPWLVGFEEVDDWIVTFAQLRALHLRRRDATTASAVGITQFTEVLAVALQPSSATGWPAS